MVSVVAGGDLGHKFDNAFGPAAMFSMIIEIRIKLKTELVLLLFAALFMSVGTNLTVARNAAAQVGSATSTKEGAGHGNAEKGSLPAGTSQPEEHGLPRKAVEIARPFGLPITNSMAVTWIVAVGLIIFASGRPCDKVRNLQGKGGYEDER